MSLDARTLRTLGEAVDGKRGIDMAIVETTADDGDRSYDALPTPEAQAAVAGSRDRKKIVLFAKENPTFANRADVRPSLAVKKINSAGEVVYTPVDPRDIEGADACFLDESAVEKFVWPYYEGMRIWDRQYLARLKDAYYKSQNIVAVIHFHPSASVMVQNPNQPAFVHYNPRDPKLVDTPELLTADELIRRAEHNEL